MASNELRCVLINNRTILVGFYMIYVTIISNELRTGEIYECPKSKDTRSYQSVSE